MSLLRGLLSLFSIGDENPVVKRRQLAALSKQLPLLYGILGLNSVALAFTHAAVSPILLTFVLPAVLVPICVLRAVKWQRLKVFELSDDEIGRTLEKIVTAVTIMGLLFTAWALSLVPYGDAYAQTHVAFFMSITVIGCILCMMHLRPAALRLTVIVTVPFTLVFLSLGNPVLAAIGLNFCLVAVIMIFIMFVYYKDFRDLVHSQEHLASLSRENHRIANLDVLTGLANRRSFFADLQTMIETSREADTRFTLGLIDLDGFKPINDVYGHLAGDALLVEVGRRVTEVLGPTVEIARLGGDEFGLILPGTADADTIREIGAAICCAVRVPLSVQAGSLQVEASVGFATFPDMADSREQLVERADYALYHAKDHHRGTAVLFTKDHERAIGARSLVEHELRRADLRAELTLDFQPLVDVALHRTVAFEALARWTNPVLGRVSPVDFITAAERMGLICRLTEVLLAKACDTMRTWPDTTNLSFNLSVHDIASETAVGRIKALILDSGIAPSRIALEITETAVMHDFDQARDALLDLKAIGCEIALDDFGTGYSSLSYVHRLPLDKIKVDRSFTAGLTSDRASRDIVKSIVDLCRNLKIACVVEGVETLEQGLILRGLGCNTMQGYHFGRPMNPTAALAFLEAEAAQARDGLEDGAARLRFAVGA